MSSVYFSQRDSRWGSKMYSSVNNASQTVKSSGCGPTCCAMIVSSLTSETVYPDKMCDISVQSGFRTSDNGTSWGLFKTVADKYDLEFEQTSNIETAINYLNNGGLVIINGRGGSDALFSTNGHYVVLVKFENNEFTIYDSDLYNGKYDLSYRKNKAKVNGIEVTVNKENVKLEARQYFCYKSKKTNVIKTMTVISKIGLNLRAEASTKSKIIKALPNGARVVVYEINNGWAKVDGGYMSAQYLK